MWRSWSIRLVKNGVALDKVLHAQKAAGLVALVGLGHAIHGGDEFVDFIVRERVLEDENAVVQKGLPLVGGEAGWGDAVL